MSVANSSPRDSYRMYNRARATALMVNAMLSHASWRLVESLQWV